MKRWNVQVGEIREEMSADLLLALGYQGPYGNDETNTARYDNVWTRNPFPPVLAEAFTRGLRGDEAGMLAVALMEERRSAQSLETARQKVAETELKAAEERSKAEAIALRRDREQREAARR